MVTLGKNIFEFERCGWKNGKYIFKTKGIKFIEKILVTKEVGLFENFHRI
ncbi:MAG: hypothetical protein N2Z58_07070 [Fervidobacterium sp.]|nr:hypothetical protein [Fervidobacterium sp.]